jgi:hypothetical protein
MDSDKKQKHSGLATLFDRVELKSLFINYLWFIVAVEVVIFLVSFFGTLGPNKGPFPWKFYFFIAFVTPVAITFLLGMFIMAFNQFIFGNASASGEHGAGGKDTDESRSKLFQFNLFITHMKRVPFLPALFALLISSILFYKLDAILLSIFNAGEKIVRYSLIASGAILVAGLIFSFVWMISKYKLNKKAMEHEYRYRKDVMEKLGFLIMQDDTVIDKNGKLVSQKPALPALPQDPPSKRETLKIMPPSN